MDTKHTYYLTFDDHVYSATGFNFQVYRGLGLRSSTALFLVREKFVIQTKDWCHIPYVHVVAISSELQSNTCLKF